MSGHTGVLIPTGREDSVSGLGASDSAKAADRPTAAEGFPGEQGALAETGGVDPVGR